MARPFWFRAGFLAALVLPATAVFCTGLRAQGQETAILWKCSRCKALVGSGPNPPSQCPHCKSRLIRSPFGGGGSTSNSRPSGRSTAGEDNPITKIAVVGVMVVVIAGISYAVMKKSMR
ncbi:MAG: hypothetical protein L0215_05390 [Gemmataceae bacterium]|nr:hypothetical protein [Gemmataceae bacterium]